MLSSVNNVIRVPCKMGWEFFRFWLNITCPFHNMTSREMDVVAYLLENRYRLSKFIKDDDLLEKVALNSDSRERARVAAGLSPSYFQIMMSTLRKNGVILEDRINPRIIPNLSWGDEVPFKLLLLFDCASEAGHERPERRDSNSSEADGPAREDD